MSTSSFRRVVVTGLGALTNIGTDTEAFWNALCKGVSGGGAISRFDIDDSWPVRIAGEVTGWETDKYIHKRESRRMDRAAHLGLHAACEAAADCGIDFEAGDPYRHGVAIGSGVGGIGTIEDGKAKLDAEGPRKVNPFTVPKLMVNAAAGHVSIRFNLKGVNTATATACATAPTR